MVIIVPFRLQVKKTLSGKRYVGLDLAKRTMEVCIVQDDEDGVKRMSGMKTDGKGRERLAGLLRESDVIGMEDCADAFLPNEVFPFGTFPPVLRKPAPAP
jgi:hypothetical protein